MKAAQVTRAPRPHSFGLISEKALTAERWVIWPSMVSAPSIGTPMRRTAKR